MSLGPEAGDRAIELFCGLGEITTRRLMGGLCLYHHGTIFGMCRPDGAILLKAAGGFVTEVEAMGSHRWHCIRGNGKAVAMPYWHLPDAALDDPEMACRLARRALDFL